ncbi:MAG: helix-turn-helix transcriptional regulator [Clostridia bacterium]|nr:helix-turn-helix transcriptional regulator [Clostridia bacterium]
MIINDEFKVEVGKRLRKLRESQGLTINKVVEKLLNDYFLDVDEKSIRRYEKGEFLPKIDNLICFADLFNSTLDYIIYGKTTSDDNSFTWYDNFKRLNRLMFTMQIKMLRDVENTSDVYLKLLDKEAKEWFGRLERFIESKRLMLDSKGIEKITDIKDLDSLFEDFKKDQTQLLPIEERIKRNILTAKPIVTTKVQEENGEITITSKIQKK